MQEQKKTKFYVVWQGREPGIYGSWAACQAQVDNFPGARYKSYLSYEQAKKAFEESSFIGRGGRDKSGGAGARPVIQAWCTDAACSGNPGVMEYRGVDLLTGTQIFHMGPFQLGTNNIGEFLALAHALALCKQNNFTFPIYTDSVNAIIWVKKKECKTKLQQTGKNKDLFDLVFRAENWLRNNTYTNRIIKWETDFWGEIPADFGRK
jgi:ribonuclease HI